MEFDSYLGTCMKTITRHKNTRINYLYRDASNYKKHNEVIVPGFLQKNRYVQLLIVCKVGSISFPAKFICRKSDSVIEQKHHPWFELNEDGFEETEAEATCYISPEDLVKLFLERKKEWQDEFYVPADWL